MGNKTKGYILACVAAATYGMNPLFTLPLYDVGMNPDSVLFLRYLFAIPVLGLMMVIRGRSFKVSSQDYFMLAIMGILVGVSSLTLFCSYEYMDAGLASTILFVYPIMVAIIMILGFKERISREMIICILLAVCGIALLQGSGSSEASLIGTLLACGSALSYAIYIVGVNKSRLHKIATLTITFYVIVFGLVLFAGRLVSGVEFTMPPSEKWYLWGCVIALAVFPTVISFLCTTSAIVMIGSTSTALLGALEPVTAVFFGVLLFGERLTLLNIIGLIAIIVAVSTVVAAPSLHIQLSRVRRLFPRRKKH